MANGQTYYTTTPELIAFINAPTFKYKNSSELSRVAGINSAKTTKKIMNSEKVSERSAKLIYALCVKEGYAKDLGSAFEKVINK